MLYGKDGKEPHDLYSMKQAIDEKFILDVTRNYVSYRTMFELIAKDPTEDQKKQFEEKKALKDYCSMVRKGEVYQVA